MSGHRGLVQQQLLLGELQPAPIPAGGVDMLHRLLGPAMGQQEAGQRAAGAGIHRPQLYRLAQVLLRQLPQAQHGLDFAHPLVAER